MTGFLLGNPDNGMSWRTLLIILGVQIALSMAQAPILADG